MLPLPLPKFNHQATYELSRERFVDENYKNRLLLGQNEVMALGEDYHARGEAKSLSSLEQSSAVAPHILAGDMQRLYKKGLLRKNSEARKIYEKIRVSSPFRICPFCLHRNVKTLDHYLPKESFGAFAVLPLNLIPCCRDCNTEKLTFNPANHSESLLHPYYDHIDENPWLSCELILEGQTWIPQFFISAANIEDDLKDRLLSHMTVLDLFNLYDVEGSRELNETKLQIRKTYASSGAEGVKNLCLEMGSSRAILAANYWRSVLWNVAASVDEFCEATWAG
jgi:hypothetical protein